MVTSRKNTATQTDASAQNMDIKLPGQVVLVMQGGGALGAYQAGVYEAMHEAGIEPDWVVGTSIGAINGALIAGNAPAMRLEKLRQFWDLVASGAWSAAHWNAFGMGGLMHNLGTVINGLPGFFKPKPISLFNMPSLMNATDAAIYSTEPLRQTLTDLVDFNRIAQDDMRLTLGAVNVRSGRMRYFDSRDEALRLDHVMASGALPPAFPAVSIDGESYWDGGIYSNTPIEVVMNDNPRRDSLILAAQLWQQDGNVPRSIPEVLSRLKDIQFNSRSESHTASQQQIHHLRHVVRELGTLLPDKIKGSTEADELLRWGCSTVMHVLPLYAPALEGEDHTKDLDFTAAGIQARWNAGREMARRKIAAAPWNEKVHPTDGIVIHG